MRSQTARLAPVLPLLAASLALGCGPAARDTEATAHLAGTWSGHFQVEAALPSPFAEPGYLAGTLVLTPPPPSVARGMDRPEHCGAALRVVPGKLAALLGETGCGMQVRVLGPDTVELTLGDRGELVMDGRAAGDSLTGRWWYGGRSAGASGRFVLHRDRAGASSRNHKDS